MQTCLLVMQGAKVHHGYSQRNRALASWSATKPRISLSKRRGLLEEADAGTADTIVSNAQRVKAVLAVAGLSQEAIGHVLRRTSTITTGMLRPRCFLLSRGGRGSWGQTLSPSCRLSH